MATTTNYGWTTPDDTALVKDGAAAIRSLGTSIDTSVKALSPGTTAGDIDYYTTSTAKARIGIGTAGQVLQVNSGATAPEWATPAGATTNYTLLNAGGTATTSGSTVTVSGISGQDKLFIRFEGVSNTATFRSVYIRLNGDSGSNYYASGVQLNNTANTITPYNSNGDSLFNVGRQGDTAAATLSGQMFLFGCNSSGIKTMSFNGGGMNADSFQFPQNGYYAGTSTISSVSILSSGTFDAGTIYVYGSSN